MVNLLVLFCSLIIQFGAVDIMPYNMLSNNQSGVGQQYIDELRSRIATNYQGYYQSTYSWINDVPDDAMVVTYGDYLWGSYQSVYKVLVPLEYSNQNSSNISCNAYTYTDNVVDSVTINFNNYIEFWIGGGNYVNTPYVNGYKKYYFDSAGDYQLIYCDKPIYCNEVLVVDVTDDVLVPTIGQGIGSLSSGGHSSGGSPSDELNTNGVTWSAHTGNFTTTGHSVQNVITPPSPDPNSNLELILSGFLGGILNNTNDILGNTSQLGSVLGGVSNNVIQGASAVFNAISNLNNTIMDFFNYIVEPLDQERISAKLEDVAIYQTINSLVGFSDSFLSAINSVQDPEHLYLTMDFRNANEPFRRLGLYVFDFTFLDNLKSTWQPILLAILYVTLGVNIFYDLPNIVHGISGLSGGDE